MDDTRKTTAQLTAELNDLRQRVAELEAAAAGHHQIVLQRDEIFARLQLVLDNMPLGCIIIDPNLRISYWNTAAEEIFGYAQAEVLGKLHYEVTVPESARAYVSTILARTAQGNLTTVGENENLTKTGQRILCEWHNTPLRDAAGRYVGILAMTQDITARKQVESQREAVLEVLRESEARYRRLVEGAPDIVYTFSSIEGGIYYSPHVEQVLGYPVEHLYAHPFLWNDSIHPDDRGYIAEAIRMFEQGTPFDLEYRVQDAQGRWRWLHDRSIGRQVYAHEVLIEGLATDITARKQAEAQREAALAALRDSEDLFKYVFDRSIVGKSITYLSGETRVNEALCNLLGYTLEEYQNRSWQEITHPDDIELTHREINALLTNEKTAARFTKRFIHKNGSVVWVDLSSSLRRDQNGQPLYLMSTLVDVTERQRAEFQREAALEALRESEEKYRNLFDNMNDAFALHQIILDGSGKPIDYKFLDANPVFANRVGMKPEELINKRALDLFPQTEPAWIEAFGEVALTGHSRQFTHYSVELDKHFETRLYCPRLGYFAAIFTDITERKRAESQREAALEALRESEILLRSTLEVAPIILFTLDVNGIFQLSTGAGLKSVGQKPGQVVGLSHFEIYKDFESANENVRRALQGETISFIIDAPTMIWNVTYSPLFDSNNTIKGMVGTAIDITERKRAEEQLLRAQKLESLGILAGGVAHDFNNLLVALLGQTSLAAAKLPPDHPAQHHLERAVMAAKRAADLTRQMLTYSGHGAFQMVPLDLNTLIHDNASFLESSISKSIGLHTELAERLPSVNADAGQMQQIIMNLVLNAAEAIGDRTGSISVTTSIIDLTHDDERWAHYTGQAVTAGRYVQLRIEDTGNGMSAATLSRIFDPFFTTKFTGRGLGLAAVLGIVRGHRGGLWVESEVGRGTTFSVILPVTTDTVAVSTPLQQKTAIPTQQSVLVIDDEEPVLDAVSDMLEMDGLSTLCAITGAEGIALFRERHADIGLILLDLSMPELNGRETFDQLLQIDPQARIVLSSGYVQAEATRGFEGRELAGFLQKPYDMETLLETVRQHLARTASE